MKHLCLTILFLMFLINLLNAQYKKDSTEFSTFRFGGYGEVLYKKMDYGPDRYNYPEGAQPDKRAVTGIPRIVFSFEYKFRSDIQLVSELEIEHGGTGSSLELEYEEAGEYEMEIEKAGEVILEQLYLQKTFAKYLKIKAGHIIVPVGRLNDHHLPVEYFTTVRPESETQIIPVTWHETGIAVSGSLRNWDYEFQLVNGLDANGFSRAKWVSSGYQHLFEETKASDMAGAFRIENSSIPNVNISVSGYMGNSTKNTGKPEKMKDISGTVSIIGCDAEFNNRRIIGRGNFIYGNLQDAYEIGSINQTISKNIQYQRTPVAKNAATWSVELGYDIFTHIRRNEKLIPFIRYEYYNTMENTTNGILADERFKRNVLTTGLNYYVLPGIAIKADYSKRIIGNGKYNTENTIGFAIVYSSYFINK